MRSENVVCQRKTWQAVCYCRQLNLSTKVLVHHPAVVLEELGLVGRDILVLKKLAAYFIKRLFRVRLHLRNKMNKLILIGFLLSVIAIFESCALKSSDCEVCFAVLEKFAAGLTSNEKKDSKVIEDKFRTFCKTSKGKDNRFCYYLGGLEESATGVLSEMAKPLSWSLPVDKVCEKLKKKDNQICDLRYEKSIDLKTVDLKKLKVRDLKKILSDWEETCEDCIEKGDFIKRIEVLKPKYVREDL